MIRGTKRGGWRLCLMMIAGLLLFSIACGEVSELAQLADDTTNDFTIRSAHHRVESPARHAPVRVGPSAVPFPTVYYEAPLFVAAFFAVPVTNLLHRICIQRT